MRSQAAAALQSSIWWVLISLRRQQSASLPQWHHQQRLYYRTDLQQHYGGSCSTVQEVNRSRRANCTAGPVAHRNDGIPSGRTKPQAGPPAYHPPPQLLQPPPPRLQPKGRSCQSVEGGGDALGGAEGQVHTHWGRPTCAPGGRGVDLTATHPGVGVILPLHAHTQGTHAEISPRSRAGTQAHTRESPHGKRRRLHTQ